MADPPPEQPEIPKTLAERENWKRLIVILEGAGLETIKVGKGFQLLNTDDHGKKLKKYGKDTNAARPDITHQCLLTLLDSPLNKAGMLQIFIHTQKNVLIEVNPAIRIPRTFKRFSGLMVQLLYKLSIRAANGPDKLLKVIKNPVLSYLPTGVRKVGLERGAPLVSAREYVAALPEDEPCVFVIGAIAKGDIEPDYVEETVSISQYPLSASVVCGKVCDAFEEAWGVL